jgi:hypothetical protein
MSCSGPAGRCIGSVVPSRKTLNAALIGLLGMVWGVAIFAAPQGRGARPAPTRTAGAALVDYQRDVQALLEERCLECHSQERRKGGLSLATYADVLEGGRSGPVVRPGNSRASLVMDRLRGAVEPQMPKDELPLSREEIDVIRRWIDEGARATPTSAPAPPPWEAPMALVRPPIPAAIWTGWGAPIDRLTAAYLSRRQRTPPATVSDAAFARRVYLDVWGLLPSPEALQAFLDDRAPDKRNRLVGRLLEDHDRYAEHWISFWNDLLRNEDGVSYFSETAGRKSITDWLLASLRTNLPYDQFVQKLVNPLTPADPDGFLTGVNWRGETSAAVMPWMQAAQNTAQIFLGVNLKCNACHDSFVSRWKLKDAYSLAAYFSPQSRLQLFRCDAAQDQYAEPAFLYPELSRVPPSDALGDRRATAAAILTDPRLGRVPRTLVNRIWTRLFGHGIVASSDEMDGKPWSPELLDWIASDFVEHGYDIKHLIQTMLTSRAYQMPAIARQGEPSARGYVFAGPEVRRLTAEQFADALGAITGEWNVGPRPAARGTGAAAPAPAAGRGGPAPTQPTASGMYAREWHVASNDLARALGRPIRDQVISTRATQSTTPQALELVNGETLTRWLLRGARRLLGELPPERTSLYNRAVAGRNATSSVFDIDISSANALWLVVHDSGSNVPDAMLPAWAQAELVGPSGVTPLSALQPRDRNGLRAGAGPLTVPGAKGEGVRVSNPSTLVYDIAGLGFTRFRGVMGLENRTADIGATLNPQLRFFVFDAAPDVERLIPPFPGAPLPPPPALATPDAVVERVFRHALGRAPSAAERRAALAALRDPARPGRPSATGLADLLWAIVMKPEFQLVY